MRIRLIPALLLLAVLLGASCRGDTMDAKAVFEPASIPLAHAVAEGDAARIRALAAQGADVNARGDRGVNLLQYAMLSQRPDALEALLEAGADPGRPGLGGSTAVHGGAIADDPVYLEIMLAHGADPDAPHGETGATPLAAATGPRTDAQFRMLLEAGADPARADRTGNTPLHKAAMINAGAQVLALLEAGAGASARNAQDATFQRYYFKLPDNQLSDRARAEREAVIKWLREHDVPLEAAVATP